jgi:uncharacterized protein (DUF1800 family)
MLANLAPKERRQRTQEYTRANRDAIEETRAWWFRRMLKSQRQLQEKMTLFCHCHFALVPAARIPRDYVCAGTRGQPQHQWKAISRLHTCSLELDAGQ